MVLISKNHSKKVFNNSYFQHIAAGVVFAGLLVIFFYPVFFENKVFLLGDFTGSDLLDLHLPFKFILHYAYTNFSIPLWSSSLSTGFPVVAEGQSGPFYPINIILAFINPFYALNGSVLFAFFVSGLGTYFYCRTLPKMNWLNAVWCGIVFMFSSFFIARLKHLNMIAVGSLLPWALYTIRLIINKNQQGEFRLKHFVPLAIVWALMFLAGHPHMAYLSLIISGCYIFVDSLFVALNNGWRNIWKFYRYLLTGIIFAGILAFCIAAIQIVPTLELTLLSNRTEGSYKATVGSPYGLIFLFSPLNPYILGNPAEGNYRGDMLRDGIWWENVLYIGLLPFMLAILMIFEVLNRLKHSYKVMKGWWVEKLLGVFKKCSNSEQSYVSIAILTFLFLSMAYAAYSVVFLIFYILVPGMSYFRFPNRFNIFVLFGLTILSGWGLNLVVLKIRYIGKIFMILLIGFLIFLNLIDLYIFSSRYLSYISIEKYSEKTEFIKYIQKDRDLFRIYSTTQHEVAPYFYRGWKSGQAISELVSLQESVPGNNSVRYGLDSFGDRAWFEGGLSSKERNIFESKLVFEDKLNLDKWQNVLNAWNIKYLFTTKEVKSLELLKEVNMGSGYMRSLKIYKNNNFMPRAYISHNIVKVSNWNDALIKMLDLEWNPQKISYVLNKEYERSNLNEKFSKKNDVVKINKYANNEISIDIKQDNFGVLVLADMYYPGWEVFVDGKRKEIFAINYISRGVEVEAGEHNIIWKYNPVSFYAGMIMTVLTLFCLVLWRMKENLYDKK